MECNKYIYMVYYCFLYFFLYFHYFLQYNKYKITYVFCFIFYSHEGVRDHLVVNFQTVLPFIKIFYRNLWKNARKNSKYIWSQFSICIWITAKNKINFLLETGMSENSNFFLNYFFTPKSRKLLRIFYKIV